MASAFLSPSFSFFSFSIPCFWTHFSQCSNSKTQVTNNSPSNFLEDFDYPCRLILSFRTTFSFSILAFSSLCFPTASQCSQFRLENRHRRKCRWKLDHHQHIHQTKNDTSWPPSSDEGWLRLPARVWNWEQRRVARPSSIIICLYLTFYVVI